MERYMSEFSDFEWHLHRSIKEMFKEWKARQNEKGEDEDRSEAETSAA